MEFYEIAERMKELRKSKKMTQQQLSQKVGISRQTLAKLEKGEISKVSLLVFIKILDTLEYEIKLEEKKPFYYFDVDEV
ncbi:MAG TPA: XRE family transcriptional regulator [Epsilonproteobacteria bacterium]|nr:XRE family transcriptional regulator [Campylobacterota bacterium]